MSDMGWGLWGLDDHTAAHTYVPQAWEQHTDGTYTHPAGFVVAPSDEPMHEGHYQLWAPTVAFGNRPSGLAKVKLPHPDPHVLMEWADFTQGGPKPRVGFLQVLATVSRGLVDRLHDEFHDWNYDRPATVEDWQLGKNSLGNWSHIEKFLEERYPAANLGFDMGMEEAQQALDRPGVNHHVTRGKTYETGPEAYDRYGYDPAEVAAGMLLLHNEAHPFRGQEYTDADEKRLVDIFTKRQKMQQDYDRKQQAKERLEAAGRTSRRTAGRPIPDYDSFSSEIHLHLSPDEVLGYSSPENSWRNRRGLDDLADDIAKNGMREPISLVTNGQHAMIDDGHHRAKAAQMAGLASIPVKLGYDRWADAESGASPVGSGLAAWLSSRTSSRHTAGQPHLHIPMDEMNQYAVWGVPEDYSSFDGLGEDIRAHGIREPLTVATDGQRAYLNDGYHRWEEGQGAGLTHLPVNIEHVHPSEIDDQGGGGTEIGPALSQFLRRSRTSSCHTASSDYDPTAWYAAGWDDEDDDDEDEIPEKKRA